MIAFDNQDHLLFISENIYNYTYKGQALSSSALPDTDKHYLAVPHLIRANEKRGAQKKRQIGIVFTSPSEPVANDPGEGADELVYPRPPVVAGFSEKIIFERNAEQEDVEKDE